MFNLSPTELMRRLVIANGDRGTEAQLLGGVLPNAMLTASLLGMSLGDISIGTLLTSREPEQVSNESMVGNGLRRQSQPMRYAQRPATYEAATRGRG